VTAFFRLAAVLLLSVPVSATVQAAEDLTALKKTLEQRFSDITISDLRPSPLPGLYEMTFGAKTALVSADGRYLLTGDLIDLETRRNLSAETRAKQVLKAVNSIGESKMIVFGPASPKRTLTVFTDVDCPYCARLHQEVPKLNAAGVKVRYLLYPRAGAESETYKRSVAVWCAKDRGKALGIAKAGGKIEMKTCTHPVDEHLRLGAEVGVEGTPALVFDDGRVVPGYAPAAQLLAALGLGDEKSGGK
jgi:thiol:disulfide interchange protein DsbC